MVQVTPRCSTEDLLSLPTTESGRYLIRSDNLSLILPLTTPPVALFSKDQVKKFQISARRIYCLTPTSLSELQSVLNSSELQEILSSPRQQMSTSSPRKSAVRSLNYEEEEDVDLSGAPDPPSSQITPTKVVTILCNTFLPACVRLDYWNHQTKPSCLIILFSVFH